MDDSSSRGLDELRALLATYGPVEVFEALSVLCTEAATLQSDTNDGVELWECAARAALDAAASLSGEDDNEDTAYGALPDDGAPFDEGEELADDPAAAFEGGVALADDAPEDDETPDEPSEATAASPAEDTRAAGQPTATPDQTHKDTTMAKDSRLGPRPAGASSWRCKRADGKRRTGTPLLWDENGVAMEEWSIRVCTADTILERWGPGSYVLQYIQEENGKRRPCGTSRVLHISGRKDGEAAVATALPTARTHAMQPAPNPAPPPIQATFMPPAMPMGDPMFANVFALMTFMNEQNERVRAAAAADTKLQLERLRLEKEAENEEKRIISQERIALQVAQNNFQAKAARAVGPLDPDTLAAKIGEAVRAQLQELRAEDDDDDDDETPAPAPVAAPAPAPAPSDPLSKILEMLGPLIPIVVGHFQTQAAAAATAAQERNVDHAAE